MPLLCPCGCNNSAAGVATGCWKVLQKTISDKGSVHLCLSWRRKETTSLILHTHTLHKTFPVSYCMSWSHGNITYTVQKRDTFFSIDIRGASQWCPCHNYSMMFHQLWWVPCQLVKAWKRLPRTCMHAEIGASLGRLLCSLHRTMTVSDAWLSRSLRESVRDSGPLMAPQLPDIYTFAKFKIRTQRAFFSKCWWTLMLKRFSANSNKQVNIENWMLFLSKCFV